MLHYLAVFVGNIVANYKVKKVTETPALEYSIALMEKRFI